MSYSSTQPLISIKVIGVGGGGSNAVNRMIEAGLSGVDFWSMNTDMQALRSAVTPNTLQLGARATSGLGAGGDPALGREAAEESIDEIRAALAHADIVFIAAGLGGGTGTGAAPIIAQAARSMGILTVAVVTRPFLFEGPRRARVAREGLTNLQDAVDTFIVIPNDRLMDVIQKRATLLNAFQEADEVVRQSIQGISDIITTPGLINVDFADVRAVMGDAGAARIGIGVADGDHRADEAARKAISSPLLEMNISQANALLVNVTAGPNLTLQEVYEAADLIRETMNNDDANIIFGTVFDPALLDAVRITVVATGFDSE